jgi:hypothetical protein
MTWSILIFVKYLVLLGVYKQRVKFIYDNYGSAEDEQAKNFH